jgi:hypothetical protein
MRSSVQLVTLAVVFFVGSWTTAFSQVSAFTTEMDRRLRAIAGDNALSCGTVAIEGDRNPEPALKCARRAIANKVAFYVRSDSWGVDSFLSEGFAGNSNGDVYYVDFDSEGWQPSAVRSEARDEKDKFGQLCPTPVHIRRIPWKDNQYVGLTCQRKKRNSSDPHEW